MIKKLTANVLVSTPGSKYRSERIQSIDLLRGMVMTIMALDHVRYYFHVDSLTFSPTDLEQTNTFLFFTRWITHFCAPVFVFLAGTSAFISGERKTKKELSFFLLTRGLWLILLECTIVSFAWSFNPEFPVIAMQVIWALGISMIALAGLIYLPHICVAAIGLLIFFGHNLLDNVHSDTFLWAALHQTKLFRTDDLLVVVAYPVLPWIGIMALGYCCGYLYQSNVAKIVRRKWLLLTGLAAVFVFIILRAVNVYGDPSSWSYQSTGWLTFLSFLNTTKYPPSLLFSLMTLGPALIFLALTENVSSLFSRPFVIIGRVPLLYYILHLYIIHLLALFAAEIFWTGWESMILERRTYIDPRPKGYGFSLPITYLVWVLVVLIMYPISRGYDRYKQENKKKWWLSYL